MSKTYQVEVEVIEVTPITIQADSCQEAIDKAISGEGQVGQRWYREGCQIKVNEQRSGLRPAEP